MNCRDVESNILGLDRGELPGSAVLEHAASCVECRRELEAIGDLRAALNALARHDEAIEAPLYLETGLLKKLAQGRELVTTGVVPRQWTSRRGLRFAFAAAALILVAIVAAIGFVRWNFVRPNPAVPVANGRASESPSPDPGAHKDDPNNLRPVPVKPEKPDRQPRTGGLAKDRERPSRGLERGAGHPAGRDDIEIATDYFPIDVGSFMQPIDGGQIVRIRLPRSAQRSYGLPVDPLRADEAVKADVVIGNDGMARAIRFVR